MGKHSTPCKYVHHWCHLCSSPGPPKFAMLVLPGEGLGHCWLPGSRVQQRPDHSLASSSRVARPLRPHGAGRGASPLAGHTAPCRACQSPAPEGWPRAVGVVEKCPGVSERGLERRKRRFLALELHSWPLPTAIPMPASGEAPDLSRSVRPVLWTEVCGPASEAERAATPASSEMGFMGKKVTVFQCRVSIWERFAPEGREEEPGLVFEHVWWVTTSTSSMRACTHAHTHTLKHTHAYTQMKETNDLDYILCYLVDYKSVKTSLYIENTSKECSLKRNKYTVTCMRCLVFMCSLNFPSLLVFQHSAQEAPLKTWVVVKNVDHIFAFSHIIKLNQFISPVIPCGGRATGGMLP